MLGSGIRSRSGIAYVYLSPILVSSVISLVDSATDININIWTVNFLLLYKALASGEPAPRDRRDPTGHISWGRGCELEGHLISSLTYTCKRGLQAEEISVLDEDGGKSFML